MRLCRSNSVWEGVAPGAGPCSQRVVLDAGATLATTQCCQAPLSSSTQVGVVAHPRRSVDVCLGSASLSHESQEVQSAVEGSWTEGITGPSFSTAHMASRSHRSELEWPLSPRVHITAFPPLALPAGTRPHHQRPPPSPPSLDQRQNIPPRSGSPPPSIQPHRQHQALASLASVPSQLRPGPVRRLQRGCSQRLRGPPCPRHTCRPWPPARGRVEAGGWCQRGGLPRHRRAAVGARHLPEQVHPVLAGRRLLLAGASVTLSSDSSGTGKQLPSPSASAAEHT